MANKIKFVTGIGLCRRATRARHDVRSRSTGNVSVPRLSFWELHTAPGSNLTARQLLWVYLTGAGYLPALLFPLVDLLWTQSDKRKRSRLYVFCT